MFEQTALGSLPVWRLLQAHYQDIKAVHLRQLFNQDQRRFSSMSLETCGVLFDYSKNRIQPKTLNLLFQLAQDRNLEKYRRALFEGERLNSTQRCPALHTALRDPGDCPVRVDGVDIKPAIKKVLKQMRAFTDAVHCGQVNGHTGKRFTDVVNIGIGGSFLGAKLACDGLKPFAKTGLKVHFISDIDGRTIHDTFEGLDPQRTLFIVASKSFTTQETLLNTQAARQWVDQAYHNSTAWVDHFVAVSARVDRAKEFGFCGERIFQIGEWVGGRYSLWSAMGLSVMLYAGVEQFQELLSGANMMDQHFLSAPFAQNMPVIMALLGIWYINFFQAQSQAILVYGQGLTHLPDYLQQLEMESNGKSITHAGQAVDQASAAVIWGQSGINAQHSFYQLMHQGTLVIPADFIAPMRSLSPIEGHHQVLLAYCFAQTKALMQGQNADESAIELAKQFDDQAEIKRLMAHCVLPGNRPSNSIVFPELDAKTLGVLLACYEHKVFVQAVIWGINPFDQWGVELGKQLANTLLSELEQNQSAHHDQSTEGLLAYYRKHA